MPKIHLLLLFIFFSLPGFGQEELIKQRETRAKSFEAMPTNDAQKMAENLETLAKDPLAGASIMDEKVQRALSELYSSGAMEKIPSEQIKANLLEKVKGSKLELILKRFPVLLDIMVDLVKNREAIPGLIRLLARKEELKNYFKIWLAIFIVSFVFKRFWLRSRMNESSFFIRFLVGLFFNIGVTLLTFFIFYNMFSSDLNAFLSILRKHILG